MENIVSQKPITPSFALQGHSEWSEILRKQAIEEDQGQTLKTKAPLSGKKKAALKASKDVLINHPFTGLSQEKDAFVQSMGSLMQQMNVKEFQEQFASCKLSRKDVLDKMEEAFNTVGAAPVVKEQAQKVLMTLFFGDNPGEEPLPSLSESDLFGLIAEMTKRVLHSNSVQQMSQINMVSLESKLATDQNSAITTAQAKVEAQRAKEKKSHGWDLFLSIFLAVVTIACIAVPLAFYGGVAVGVLASGAGLGLAGILYTSRSSSLANALSDLNNKLQTMITVLTNNVQQSQNRIGVAQNKVSNTDQATQTSNGAFSSMVDMISQILHWRAA